VSVELSAFLGVILFGLFHGLNPSHGWTVAVIYSLRKKRKLINGIISSGIIAGGHFLSSIVVLIAFLLVTSFYQVPIPKSYLNYVVAVTLGVLAYIFWREETEDLNKTQHGHLHYDAPEIGNTEHAHDHWHKDVGYHSHSHLHLEQRKYVVSLSAIAAFGIVLGFAHEEEFVIFSLAVGGLNPVFLILSYALSVSAALIGVTVLSVKVYTALQNRIIPYIQYLPKISACVLGVMALGFAIGIF